MKKPLSNEEAVIIWTENEVWLQTEGCGGAKFSCLGRIPLASIERFCRDRGIDLVVDEGRRRIRVAMNDPLPEFRGKPFESPVMA